MGQLNMLLSKLRTAIDWRREHGPSKAAALCHTEASNRIFNIRSAKTYRPLANAKRKLHSAAWKSNTRGKASRLHTRLGDLTCLTFCRSSHKVQLVSIKLQEQFRMDTEEFLAEPKPAPPLNIPSSGNVVQVHVIDR